MVYHIYNKSIANFVIFNDSYEFSRMLLTMRYYQPYGQMVNLSRFIRDGGFEKRDNDIEIAIPNENEKLVEIIAYCIMPTHLHLILKESKEKGISIFISNILNSYARYFNIKHRRKGPLWEGRTKRVFAENNEQLLHLTRYIHLNPVTAYMVDKPEEWPYSSYKEYTMEINNGVMICKYDDLLDINPSSYKEFVEDRISYQRELAKIKSLILE